MNESILHPNSGMLQDFAEASLGEADRAVIESHVLECTRCHAEVEEWRVLFGTLAALPQFSPSVHFADNVMHHVRLPDPWYVRALVYVGDRAQKFAPKTTRGWALASAFLALPFAAFALFATWLLSKPYITPSNVLAFVVHRGQELVSGVAQSAFAAVLQTDIALLAARGLNAISTAGIGTAGALFAGVAVATLASAYVLYQNLFRADTQRNHGYVTYSF